MIPAGTSSKSADRLWCLGLIGLIGAALLAFAALDWDGVWILGSWVPRRIDAVGALSGTGLLLLLIAVRCKHVMARRGSPPRRRHRARVIGARLMTVAVLFVALPLTAFVAFLDGWDAFHVLHPASAGGCRIVVQESDSFDSTISATVYLVSAGEHRAREVGQHYGSRDQQFSQGRYEVSWDGQSADLSSSGGPASGPWACPR